MSPAPVSAMVCAYRRAAATVDTLGRLYAATPPPAEVLVHVDGQQQATADAVRAAFPTATVFLHAGQRGPGGARDWLLRRARHDLVASFDDDSYPLDPDYFARLVEVFDQFPTATVVAAEIHEQSPLTPAFRASGPSWVADFVGCGCAYRRAAYLPLPGYLPLPLAYGCEEADLSLQVLDHGGAILFHPGLRVRHDSPLSHHPNPAVNAAALANLALRGWVRYPKRAWPLAAWQVLSRLRWALRHGRPAGLARGLAQIPGLCARFRQHRRPVRPATLARYRALQQQPEVA